MKTFQLKEFIMFKQFLMMLFLIVFAKTAFAEEKEMVAVLQFTGNIPKPALDSATAKARSGAFDMLPPDKFKVLTEENTREILTDNGIDLSCVEGQCEAETLRNIQASYGLTGTVNEVAGKIELVIRLYDVSSAELLGQTNEAYDTAREMLDDVTQKTKGVVVNIPGAGLGSGVSLATVQRSQQKTYKGDDIVNVDTGKTGFLVISSQPDGAAIFINGENKGVAPLELEVGEGKYVIVGDKGKYYHQATTDGPVEVRDGESLEVPLVLTPAYGHLVVKSNPSGAMVYISGEPVGETPYENKKQASGVYNIKIEKSKFFPVEERIIVEDEKKLVIEKKLDKSNSSIEIVSNPPGADIWLDGEKIPDNAKTPHVLYDQQKGPLVIRLSKPKYKMVEKEITVKAGHDEKFVFDLDPNYSDLRVETNPPGAAIFLDGVDSKKTSPYTFDKIDAGRITVEVKLKGHGGVDTLQKITIPDDGGTVTHSVDFVPILGTLVVKAADPTGKSCKADVYLNGEKIGVTPLKTQQLALEHEIFVDCNGMTGMKKITLVHNQREDVLIQVNQYTDDDIRRSNLKRISAYTTDAVLVGSAAMASVISLRSFSNMNIAYKGAEAIDDPLDGDLYYKYVADGDNFQQVYKQSMIIAGAAAGLGVAHHLLRTRRLQKEHNRILEMVAQAQGTPNQATAPETQSEKIQRESDDFQERMDEAFDE